MAARAELTTIERAAPSIPKLLAEPTPETAGLRASRRRSYSAETTIVADARRERVASAEGRGDQMRGHSPRFLLQRTQDAGALRGDHHAETSISRAKTLIEIIKALAEILALLAAGLWALQAYSDRKNEDELSGLGLKRVNLALETMTTQLSDGRYWVLSKLTLRNPTKRVAKILLVSWSYWVPTDAGDQELLRVKNDGAARSVAPGEEVIVAHSRFFESSRDATIVQAEVNFEDTADGRVCVLDPSQPLPDGGLDELEDRPRICIKGQCPRGCEGQSVETLVRLKPASPATRE